MEYFFVTDQHPEPAKVPVPDQPEHKPHRKREPPLEPDKKQKPETPLKSPDEPVKSNPAPPAGSS